MRKCPDASAAATLLTGVQGTVRPRKHQSARFRTLFMRGLRPLSWRQVKHRLGYDDALDAFGVHGVGGLVGGVLTGCLCVCVRVCVSMCVCWSVRACARACVRRPVDGVLTGRRRRPAGPGRARIPEVLPADLPSCCFYAGWSSAP